MVDYLYLHDWFYLFVAEMGLGDDEVRKQFREHFDRYPESRPFFDKQFSEMMEDESLTFREKAIKLCAESLRTEEEARQLLLRLYHVGTGEPWKSPRSL